MTIPYATITKSDYENFSAECYYPICKFWNIYNRRTDLKNIALITYQEVQCEKCNCFFVIYGDEASEKWEYLLYDCSELLKNKKYMSCVLNVAQAHEVFFYTAIKKKLLYDPLEKKILRIDEVNDLSEKLHKVIERATLPKLKDIFIAHYYGQINLDTKEQIESAINNLKKKKTRKSLPRSFDEKDTCMKKRLNEQIKKVWDLRCKVIHKEAYRPTKDEAEGCVKQARETLMRLNMDYKIQTPISFCRAQ